MQDINLKLFKCGHCWFYMISDVTEKIHNGDANGKNIKSVLFLIYSQSPVTPLVQSQRPKTIIQKIQKKYKN